MTGRGVVIPIALRPVIQVRPQDPLQCHKQISSEIFNHNKGILGLGGPNQYLLFASTTELYSEKRAFSFTIMGNGRQTRFNFDDSPQSLEELENLAKTILTEVGEAKRWGSFMDVF
jgi:hypothetical protein